jgi:phage/plasmid-like protein (TIGR03299 family)
MHNVESMMWTGNQESDKPWHMAKEKLYGYGGESPMTARETMELARLDWRVALHPAAVEIGGQIYKSDAIHHIVRDRDCKILGTVTDRYQPIQNSEAFEFLDSVVGEIGQLRYVTAGSIDGGKRVWLLAQITSEVGTLEPLLGDKVNSYLMLTSGHDGKNSLRAKFTTVRIVCQNTLNLALRTGDAGITIKHTGDPARKVRQAREILGLASDELEAVRRSFRWLSEQKADNIFTQDFLKHMTPVKDNATEMALTRAANTQKDLLQLVNSGRGTHIPGVFGSRWGLLNAITEYNQHERTYRTSKESQEQTDTNRFDQMFGGGPAERMNQRALDFLLQDAPDSVYKPAKRKELELA